MTSISRTIIISDSCRFNQIRLFHLNFLFIIIIILISSISFSNGSHYMKYHMSDYCDQTKINLIEMQPHSNMTAIIIKLKRESYKPNMNCSIHLNVPSPYGLMAFITKLKMRRLQSKADYIEFITNGHSLIRFHGINQEMVPKKTILTSSETMTIRFVSEPQYYSLPGKGFKIVVNLFAPTNEKNECDENIGLTMNCQNKFCIDSILECDGIDNCRNDIDELQCDETSETKLSLYVFLFTLLIMFILLVMFFTKSKDRRKIIVRRMSEAYANNHPILYAMENNSGTESPTNSNTSVDSSSPNLNNIISSEITMIKRPISSLKSQLSLSLPHGIERLHNNINDFVV
ncbi:Suppressor of tumorigenicity 14 protein [Dermatophagoides pteronyssinus]|uniref:Suppressor of tumorigenicity 14 protein n=1 Tax=Dermatophagoides pteronyssinus TaxID=6956 RepID=A0ABQ8IPZ0_DERPT|nr:Suppressor of tumorigenicity 14 protein [Dermatophagoides pteronyssinus]